MTAANDQGGWDDSAAITENKKLSPDSVRSKIPSFAKLDNKLINFQFHGLCLPAINDSVDEKIRKFLRSKRRHPRFTNAHFHISQTLV